MTTSNQYQDDNQLLNDFAQVLRNFRDFVLEHEIDSHYRQIAISKIEEMLTEISRIKRLPEAPEKPGTAIN